MAVILRLRRMGMKKKPIYRIVALDSRKRRDGAYLEALGQYDPNKEENQVTMEKERIQHWLSQGAQVSATVKSLLKKEGITQAG